MSDFTLVNKASMTSGIDALSRAHKDLRDHLSTLEGQLNQSLAQWDGNGQAAYREAKAKWDASADKMAQVINKMTSTLGLIDEAYTANESNIAGRWSGH
jgi:WXG100 family type VII secretion target